MKIKIKLLVATIVVLGSFFFGQGIAFSSNDYDDVYENSARSHTGQQKRLMTVF